MIYVIGIGASLGSLSQKSIDIIRKSGVVVGGERHLKLVKDIIQDKKTITIKGKIEDVLNKIEEEIERMKERDIAILNSGDPLFYGMAKSVISRFGKEMIEVIPNISSIQLAFARVKENWDDAKILSIHAGKKARDIVWDLMHNSKICILTLDGEDPKRLADIVKDYFFEDLERFFVLEELGGERERVLEFTKENIHKVGEEKFSPLNVVLILKKKRERFFGEIRDNLFYYKEERRGLITKSEIRAISISKLLLKEDDILWDIGAGSGSVSISASQIITSGKIFAIEKDEEDINFIRRNVDKFKIPNIEIVFGVAPECFYSLPQPSNVFIGGGGDRIPEILKYLISMKRDSGNPRRIVANFITIENLYSAIKTLEKEGMRREEDFEIVEVFLSRATKFYLTKFEPITKVFILTVY